MALRPPPFYQPMFGQGQTLSRAWYEWFSEVYSSAQDTSNDLEMSVLLDLMLVSANQNPAQEDADAMFLIGLM